MFLRSGGRVVTDETLRNFKSKEQYLGKVRRNIVIKMGEEITGVGAHLRPYSLVKLTVKETIFQSIKCHIGYGP